MIVVGLKGFGISSLLKIVSFVCNFKYQQLDMNADFGDVEWNNEIRSKIQYCGQDDKQLCWVVDEYRITDQNWYKDIELLMTCAQSNTSISKNE